MPNKKMSSLTIGANTYEITDAEARQKAKALSENFNDIYSSYSVCGKKFATGGNMTPNNRITTGYIWVTKDSRIKLIDKNYLMTVNFYDISKKLIKEQPWSSDDTVVSQSAYAIIYLSKKDSSSFTNVSEMDGKIAILMSNIGEEPATAENDSLETAYINAQARHTISASYSPLTLLHFSDVHGDSAALSRILKKSRMSTYDDAICTGDITPNTYEKIISWWDSSIMTCIGNHDTATYNSTDGYNWTALSMADRDAYYITPFKSDWDVEHVSGCSYYYKDYTSKKIRLIVIDVMLYASQATQTEATAQTTWLTGLLASAITSNLHVLIAAHAPHPTTSQVQCSFSRYNQTTTPSYTECNVPDSVTSAVASSISDGLHFIGYLCGHTHQDDIWDALGDKTQLQYCITCAAVSYAPQWQATDMYRSEDFDAFNLVTIDTTRSLIKIVRGGGANIDDHMRPRRAICIDYSTGTVISDNIASLYLDDIKLSKS